MSVKTLATRAGRRAFGERAAHNRGSNFQGQRGVKSVVALLCSVCLFLALLYGLPSASTARGVRLNPPAQAIPRALFGMHIHHLVTGAPKPTPWPRIPFGTWRLWDAYVTWFNLEPEKGKWDFSKLDKYLALAEEHDVGVLLPLSMTPPWASGDLRGHDGHTAPPDNISDWQDYVRTVAIRYKGRVHDYELWNEPNLKQYYSGSIPQMVQLARVAYQVLKQVDQTIIVCSPDATAERGLGWLDQYLRAGGGKYADAICYHVYVNPKPPEALLELIGQIRAVMARNSVAGKPIWDSESGWASPKPFPQDEAAAYVARSYILQWADGVSRSYWYSWDNQKYGLQMTESDEKSLTPAGTAYGQVENWLVGATMTSCNSNSKGIWTCSLTRPGNYRAWIVWDPDTTVSLTVPATWKVNEIRDLRGGSLALGKARAMKIGPAPLLLVSSPR